MAKTNTTRSKMHLEADGWKVAVVEHWNPGVRRRVDLFGFIDLLAIRPSETLAIQVTDGSHVAARVAKIAEHPNTPAVRQAGWGIHVHGWRRNAKGVWVLRVVDVS